MHARLRFSVTLAFCLAAAMVVCGCGGAGDSVVAPEEGSKVGQTTAPSPNLPIPAAAESDVNPSATRAPSISSPVMISALAGWAVCGLLSLLMLALVTRWKTAFETKEWLLMPSQHGAELARGFVALGDQTVRSLESVVAACNSNSRQAAEAAVAARDTRGEFTILRDELDRKTKEVADLKMGHEFHHRRPLLRRIIRALEIIEEDAVASRDAQATLAGVIVELQECLEENSVTRFENPPGTKLAEARSLDVAGCFREPAPDESVRGTVAATLRPAYVARGPNGDEVVLLPGKATVYV